MKMLSLLLGKCSKKSRSFLLIWLLKFELTIITAVKVCWGHIITWTITWQAWLQSSYITSILTNNIYIVLVQVLFEFLARYYLFRYLLGTSYYLPLRIFSYCPRMTIWPILYLWWWLIAVSKKRTHIWTFS